MSHKKLILSAFVLLTLLSGLHAQQPRWSLAVSAGAAIPVGKFAGKSFHDTSQSIAQLGPLLNIQLDYRINAHFGAALLLSCQENIVDINSIQRQVQSTDSNADSYTAVSSGQWVIGKILAGPTLSLPIGTGKKWEFTARLLGGALKTYQPKLAITRVDVYNGGSAVSRSLTTETKATLPWAFAYQAGAGLRYSFNRRLQFRADLDYTATMATAPFNYTRSGHQYVFFSGGNGTPVMITQIPHSTAYTLPIATLNISMGLEFRL